MKLDAFLISFVIFTAIVISGVLIIEDVNTSYNVTMNTSDFSDTFNTTSDMYDITQGMNEHTLEGELSDDNIVDSTFKGSFSAVRLVKNTFTLFTNILNDISGVLGVPSFFVELAVIALTIAVIFAMIYIFMRV